MEEQCTKTCKKLGHPMTPENTYRGRCKECIRIEDRGYYELIKDSKKAKRQQDSADLAAYRELKSTTTKR